jgi:CheY-like chemotaxis protein
MPLGGRLSIETAAFVSGQRGAAIEPVVPGRYVLITVSDDGAGMDGATRARIFEPFFTTKPPGKGTGLGLATVYGIIKQTGGEIACDSQPGAGTRFSIFLPATDRLPAAAAVPVETPLGGTETVLLVEDQVAVRRLTRRILESYGYAVRDTGDTEAALKMAIEAPFDVLLSDVVMPQMSGPELARRVREEIPGVRVLFMSGFAGHSALSELAGAPLLDKPFGPAALIGKLREVLHG